MSLKYLLDTNVLSEPLRPRPDPKILEGIRRHQEELEDLPRENERDTGRDNRRQRSADQPCPKLGQVFQDR